MDVTNEIHSEEEDNIAVIDPAKMEAAEPVKCGENEMAIRLREAQELSKTLVQHIETTAPDKLVGSEVPFVKKKEEKPKAETKAQIITKILALQQELKVDNPRPESHFQRMNKPELSEHLMWLTNKAVNKIQGTTHELKNQTEVSKQAQQDEDDAADSESGDDDGSERAKPFVISKNAGAQQLFNMNMLIVRCAELASVNLDMKSKMGANLEGLSKDCLENQDELKKILAQIYEENSSAIAYYLSPINQYFMFMSTIAVNRLAINKFREDGPKN